MAEVLLGLKTDAQATRIAGLMDAFQYTPGLARVDYIQAATLYRACRAKGFTVRSTVDCLIAQICLRDGLSLLSKDRDFESIAKCSALKLVDVVRQ